MKKKILITLNLLTGLFFNATPAFAHVVVQPNEVGVAQRVNFTISVPTEEEVPTVGVRLVIPEGLESVTPNVKPGWNIEIIKSGEDENERVTEIIWTGGSIPAEQRDEFVFRAMAPAEETELHWKAYQTYEGGEIVAWDADPKEIAEYEKNNPPQPGQHDEHAPKPFSVTKVINDLSDSQATDTQTAIAGAIQIKTSMILSVGAVVMSAIALGMQLFKKK